MSTNVGSAVGYLDLDINGFLSGLRTAQSESERASGNIATKLGGKIESVGKSLTSVGSSLTKSATLPVVGLGTAIIKTSADFESSMSKVKAITGKVSEKDLPNVIDTANRMGLSFVEGANSTETAMNIITAKAREMGSKTKFSASESAEAFQYMAMAGWKTEDMLNSIEGVMNLAAASGEELGTVSDIVTDAMTAFGMSARGTSKVLKDGVEVEVSNCTRFVDALAAASNSSNTNVSMLGESFKYVAPVCGALGYDVEDTAVALGLMANQGIKASSSGTALRSILTNLAKPTDTMSAAMDYLGISLQNDDGSMKSLMEVMDNLRGSFGQCQMPMDEFQDSLQEIQSQYESGEISESKYNKKLEDLTEKAYGAEGALKAKYAATIAGKTGMAGLLAIVNTSDEDFQSLTDSIYNAAGTSQEMADIMQDNLLGQITVLGSSLQELALQFGDLLLPYIKKFTEFIQNLVMKMQQLSPRAKSIVSVFAAIVASIGPLLLVIGKLTEHVGKMITFFGKVPEVLTKVKSGFSIISTAISGVSAPILAIIAIVGTLVAAFMHLWNTNEEFRNNIISIWNGIKEKFDNFVQGIVDRLNALGFDFESGTEVLKAIWDGFCSILAPIFEGAFEAISAILGAVFDVITGLLDIFIGIFTGNWEQAWKGVEEVFGGIWNGIKGIFSAVCNTLKGILNSICGWFGTTWEDTWNSIKNFFSNIWNSITSFLSKTWDTIKKVVQVGIMAIVEIIKAAFQLITLPFRFIWENCKDKLKEVWELIKGIISKALNVIKENISKAWKTIVSVLTPILNTIKSAISTAWNAISGTIKTVLSTIKSIISTAWNAVVTLIKPILDKVKTTISNAWDNIKTKVSNVINGVKNTISNGLNSAKNTVSNILSGIKDKFSNILSGALNIVSNAIEKIKSKFNFNWSLPRLKLPHFYISGGFSLDPPSVPHFGIQWYAKAMRDGMVMNEPTIFGFDAKTGRFLAGGEAGSEVVVGTQSLLSMIKMSVREATKGIELRVAAYCAAVLDVYSVAMANVGLIFCKITELNESALELITEMNDNANSLLRSDVVKAAYGDILEKSNMGFSYDMLSRSMADVLREAPIIVNAQFDIKDGDIYLDNEKVGKKLTPVISRRLAKA